MSYLQEAFHQVCSEAKLPEGAYVSLMEVCQRYGGPEEGGWWATDTHLVAYKYFTTEEAAELARQEIEKLAKELTEQAKREYGDQCLREMDWLDARGLDADYLPEPDGVSEFVVVVSEGLPEERRGPSHYE